MVRGFGLNRNQVVPRSHADLIRGAACVVLTLVLVLVKAPVGLVLVLPVMTYGGLRLLNAPRQMPQPNPSDDDRATFARCVDRWQAIQSLITRTEDPRLREPLHRILGTIDSIIQAIEEDGSYRVSLALLGLLEPTHDLLTGYARIVERGLVTGDVRERVLGNLATLESAYIRFWERLNRGTLVQLDALNDTIDFYLDDPVATARRGERGGLE
jgi:hypothetical protein